MEGLSLVREEVRFLNQNIAGGAPVPRITASPRVRVNAGFRCYGAAKALWDAVIAGEPQAVIHGPAETGKSMATLHLLDWLCWNHKNLQCAIVRKTAADMPGTILQTWENKVIMMPKGSSKSPDGITKYGGEKAGHYDYPSGSRIWVGGMDHPGKVLSAERDVVLCNQVEEFEENDWETISTRTTGRGGGLVPGILIGDANPGPSTHWILAHEQASTLKMFASKHEDNPVLFNPLTHEITEQGKLSLAALDKLTGVRYKRLRKGLWVAAEGVVYETFDPTVHIVDKPVSEIQYNIASVDWGFTNPGVIQVWGVDGDARMYRRAEIYQTGKLIDWWIAQGRKVKEKYNLKYFVPDPSRPDYIDMFENAGLDCEEAYNSVDLGIQNVQSRLVVQEDGHPRLMLLKNSSDPNHDPELIKAHKPTSTEQEIEVYAYPKDPKETAEKEKKEEPVAKNNHGLDCTRYAAADVDGLGGDEVFFA